MKIFLEATDYPPYTSLWGGGVVYKALAQEYKKLGHDVTVVFWRYDSKTWFEKIKKFTDDNDIKFIEIPLIPTPKKFSFFNSVFPIRPWRVRVLKKIFKKAKPDFVHLHGYGLFFTNQLASICKKLWIPYTLTLHGAPVTPWKKRGIISFMYNIYKNTLWKKLLENTDDLTAVSNYTIENFTEFHPYKDKIRVVPNGIYSEEFEKKVWYNIYDKYNLPSWSTIYLSIGRIERLKWFDQFIKIIPDLVKKWIDARYFIAGKDNWYKKNLDTLANDLWVEDRIYYLWYISWDDKLSMLQNAEFLIITSRTESFGLTALEAMASGLIPIVSDVWWLKEIIQDGKNGIIIDLNETENISNVKWTTIDKDNMMITVQKYNRTEIAKIYTLFNY